MKELRGRGGRVTIRTVAEHAGRSISTVSAALNGSDGVAEKTRGEILRIAAELGYQADPRAQFLRRSHTGLIGASFAIGQAYQGLIVDGLYQAASRLGHGLVLATSTPHRDVADGLRSLLLERCEGIILINPDIPVDALARIVDRTPAVLIGSSTELNDVDEIHSRDDVGIQLLVDHLVDTGRRRITHIDGGRETAAKRRTTRFAEAMDLRGLGRDTRVVPGGGDEDSGARAVRHLIESGELPEALLCFNDHCAVGALMELRRQGVRVPQDMAVTGYDGIPVTAASAFSLTTVRQNAGLIAEVAVRALLARMHPDQDGRIPAEVVGEDRRLVGRLYRVVPDLVIRETTARGA
ncbi:LacI family DNA-binding transcriptional regulator [Actinomyces sp. oral taxon 170]|uniref:LacI family DNA-binding transcriptional regulator n=2 Tax=Actinomyces TaxID=1654 RepID=UPI0002DD3516